MKVAIVMTYFDRQQQLDRTLASLRSTSHKKFSVIIVDDCSPAPPVIQEQPFPVQVIKTTGKRWIDGSPAYNFGFIAALRTGADVILIQNAEAYHVGDVITRACTVTQQSYISFACYNLSKHNTARAHDIHKIISHSNFHAVNNEDDAWLNHRLFRPMGYHWCAAITADNLRRLNGFDERFADGYCFEDDELLARVKILGLQVEITDQPFVVHQFHARSYVPANWQELYNLNKRRFEAVRTAGNPQAVHHFTKNLHEV
jgi:GT2 family glycosyltransferase